MLINSLFLSISSSIDSLGIGITYGIRNTKISIIAKIILFCISFFISILSIFLGDFIKTFFSESFSKIIGSIILIFMGIFMCFQSLKKEKLHDNSHLLKNISKNKNYTFFIKGLGITIKIIKNPIYSDIDNSNLIDGKEALFLGLALSLDSLCIGIAGSASGINSYIFPFLVSIFQLCFLSLGNFLGEKLYKSTNLPNNIWSIFSGVLLIIIGGIKIFF